MNAPALSVVVIGRNEGDRLLRCLASVKSMVPPEGGFEVIYVDSGSTDGSPESAEQAGARVLSSNTDRPSAAAGRNVGWRAARGTHVLFLDGDTVLDPRFAIDSLSQFEDERVAIVWGHRRELHPERNWYQRVLDLDWVYAPGETAFCGGDALVRRSALEEVKGFDETLIAGEEPDLCRRLRERGHVILHVDRAMTGHDLAIRTFGAYWKRAFRAGLAYAQVSRRFACTSDPFWRRELLKNRVHVLFLAFLPIATATACLLTRNPWPLLALFLVIAALVLRTASRCRWKEKSFATRWRYAVHSHLQQIPIFCGQCAAFLDRATQRKRSIVEYKDPLR